MDLFNLQATHQNAFDSKKIVAIVTVTVKHNYTIM